MRRMKVFCRGFLSMEDVLLEAGRQLMVGQAAKLFDHNAAKQVASNPNGLKDTTGLRHLPNLVNLVERLDKHLKLKSDADQKKAAAEAEDEDEDVDEMEAESSEEDAASKTATRAPARAVSSRLSKMSHLKKKDMKRASSASGAKKGAATPDSPSGPQLLNEEVTGGALSAELMKVVMKLGHTPQSFYTLNVEVALAGKVKMGRAIEGARGCEPMPMSVLRVSLVCLTVVGATLMAACCMVASVKGKCFIGQECYVGQSVSSRFVDFLMIQMQRSIHIMRQ
jgi:hypothetical protein